jgi:hypothetical protein
MEAETGGPTQPGNYHGFIIDFMNLYEVHASGMVK